MGRVLHVIAKPGGVLDRVSRWAFRSCICLFLAGCAAHRPPVPESPASETHRLRADEATALRSCVEVLRTAGYVIDDADADDGILRGSLITQKRLGVILDGDHHREPFALKRWQAGLLALTGAALLVGGIASQGQVDMNAVQNNQVPSDGSMGVLWALGIGAAVFGVAADAMESPRPVYEYQVAVQLLPMEGNTTQVRVVLDGTERQNGEDLCAGPVNAPEFINKLYSALDRSVRLEQEPGIPIR